jgi:phosphinothricin acetyltransferase
VSQQSNSAGVTVRPAGVADLDAITRIFTHYVETTVATFNEVPLSRADWERKLADLTERKLPFLVADAGGEVAGFAYAGPFRPQHAYRYTVEDTIYLAPGHTGRGLGGLLLQALLDACADAGVRQVVAVIAASGNDASPALHRKFGFTDAGRLTDIGYKHDRWIDVVLMQKQLPGRS